jgi:hypothetical protein
MKVGSKVTLQRGLHSLYLAVFGFFISSIVFYPGFMSADSLAQYAASKSLLFDDWHPPIMSWVWSILNLFFQGPEGLLYFHLSFLWLGLYIWFLRYRDQKYSWLILIIGFLPWVINFSGVLWKDVGMAFSLLLFAGLGVSERTPARGVLALMLLFYAVNIRHNAIFAVIPIVALVVGRWFVGASKLRMITLTVATLVGIVALGNAFNYKVLRTYKSNPLNQVLVDDLSYLSLINKKSLIPGIPLNDIRDCATVEVGGQTKLVFRLFCLSKKESYLANNPLNVDLKTIWLTQVATAPIEYANFRLAAFAYLLRSPDAPPYYIWHSGIDENKMEIKQRRNGATILVEWLVQKTSEVIPFVFKPYWWLWFTFMLLLSTFTVHRNTSTSTIQALLVSSIFYVIGYVPITTVADFRFVYWSVIATTLATILFFLDRHSFAKNQLGKNISLALIAIVITVLLFNINKIFTVDISSALMASVN